MGILSFHRFIQSPDTIKNGSTFIETCGGLSARVNKEGNTLCWLTSRYVHCLFLFLIGKHAHTYTLKYKCLLLYNYCPTMRKQMSLQADKEAGTIAVYVCNGAVLAQTSFYNQAQRCQSVWPRRNRIFRLPGRWSKNKMVWKIEFLEGRPSEGLKEKHVFQHSCPEECCAGSLFFNAAPCVLFPPEWQIVSLAISIKSTMQSRPIITNES